MVSIRFSVKLDYIRLDYAILKVCFTRLTSGVYMHLYMEKPPPICMTCSSGATPWLGWTTVIWLWKIRKPF